ncbi:MAG TPA: hypothetical protein DGT23_12100 [Micromonosporaceae bacterium]|nr:hypothetical protein [Micromonosporaceae bacterium]
MWHEPTRISHGDALAKARAMRGWEPHPAIPAFHEELVAQLPDVQRRWDKKSHVRIEVKEAAAKGAVPRIRYLAAKHRLVCFDLSQDAVVNPPLLRRPDSYELATDAGLPIEDPAAEHIARAAHSLSDDNWFMALEGDDDHFVQCGFGKRAGVGDGRYMLETRDEKHLQVDVDDVAEVIAAFQAHLIGDHSWRDKYAWRPVNLG